MGFKSYIFDLVVSYLEAWFPRFNPNLDFWFYAMNYTIHICWSSVVQRSLRIRSAFLWFNWGFNQYWWWSIAACCKSLFSYAFLKKNFYAVCKSVLCTLKDMWFFCRIFCKKKKIIQLIYIICFWGHNTEADNGWEIFFPSLILYVFISHLSYRS